MNLRWLGLGLALILAIVGVIWLASAFESGTLGKPKAPPVEGLVVELKPQDRDDYVVVCNEAAFREAFERFGKYVKVTTDALTAPGGPAVIALGDVEVPMELQRPKRVVIEVLKRHSPKRVVLMAHEECLIDDSIGAWYDDPGGVRRRQYVQLARARQAIHQWLPTTIVEIYYGEKYGTNKMRFFRVPDHELQGAVESVDALPDSLRVHSK